MCVKYGYAFEQHEILLLMGINSLSLYIYNIIFLKACTYVRIYVNVFG